ncbi:hypothetical protein [Priestia koreensis]|uniref:hypothetical protein n=1 Tax=Priestia koreensis TaxID=284581 RepID=UPI0020422CEF|nr:hypothetical protein [Priestia koreensis]MCM3004565.1 hypothetical protein [Priestia koreensis]
MKPKYFLIEMYPTVSFKEEETLRRLLDVLESHESFKPTHWGNSETIKVEYNREELIQKVIEEGNVSEIYLHRNKSVSYTFNVKVNSSPRSFLDMDFSKSIPEKLWANFFTLSDQLAEIAKPRFGLAHPFWPAAHPWNTERERVHKWMNICAQPVPVRFLSNGPLGLGMRTYIGSEILDLVDAKSMQEIPAFLSTLEWGGIKIDLVEDPLDVNLDTLLDRWLEAMNHLKRADFIATPNFEENRRRISFSPSPGWKRYLTK